MKIRLLAAAILLAATGSSFAQGESLRVSLVTFSPGAIYWQRFGHNAILVRDPATGEAWGYHWGLFDFEQENFFLNFARGRMRYRIAAWPADPMLEFYRREGRSALEQKLNLTPAQRDALDRFLRWNAQPENAEYRYDYFLDNCSTRVRDALDGVLDGALRPALTDRAAAITWRSESVRLLWPDRALALVMDLALGPAADRPLDLWAAAFSPVSLMQSLREVSVADGTPLVASETELYAGPWPDPPARYPPRLVLFLALGLLLAGAILTLAFASRRRALRAVAAAFLLSCGVTGLISVALWGLTEHWAGWGNPLLLVLNPLCLFLLTAWLRPAGAPRASQRRFAMLVLALALASPIALAITGAANGHWLALLLPGQLALSFLLLRQPVRA